MAAPFSRLQLAAALLEYDNDSGDPSLHRSAYDSAIFAHVRRGNVPLVASRKSDYLGVALPSETGSIGGRESRQSGRRSRASMDALQNPFRESRNYDEDNDEENDEVEVDLASWGLDAFMPKDKKDKSKSSKGKARATRLSDAQPLSAVSSHIPQTLEPELRLPVRATRSLSVGNYDHLSIRNEHPQTVTTGDPTPVHRHTLSQPVMETLHPPSSGDSRQIPFPSASVRSLSPTLDTTVRPRSISALSFDSKNAFGAEDTRQRTNSNATRMSATSRMLLVEDNPFAIEPPSRASRFDPKAAAHARTMSVASLGSRFLDNDALSVQTGLAGTGRDRRASVIELLRPKVLVMPSPLQPATSPVAPPEPKPKDGFLLSSDGPPLPPGAKSARRSSATLSTLLSSSTQGQPIASNSFTPNPRMNLSLSQLTFRNNLLVGGKRDVSYTDIDGNLFRATEEGQQVQLSADSAEVEDLQPSTPLDDRPNRPAGKLYGKSLIDDLEERKALMRSKQRVFRGDDRPSMMARNPLQRSSTLIDPASLKRPVNQRQSSFDPDRPDLNRRLSTRQPLLNFDEDNTPPLASPVRGTTARSVFGVDTLWEKEMAKLKVIEAQEKLEAEEREKREAEMAANKKKKKGKHPQTDDAPQTPLAPAETRSISESRVSIAPPVLPVIPPLRAPPPVVDGDSDSGDSDDEYQPQAPNRPDVKDWNAGSSDEEDQYRIRHVETRGGKSRGENNFLGAEDDSDEDLPLAATARKISRELSTKLRVESDSDEDRPLSTFRNKDATSLHRQRDADDDDNVPLALRASRHFTPNSPGQDALDDEQPLAFHPEQQRKSQFNMLVHQQQQAMLQAQMQANMFLNPMMASGFFPQPMMIQPPVQVPSPPLLQDPVNYGRVDRWRHDVVVEGNP